MKQNAQAKRQWANLALAFGNKKAQALTELAVFGTVLIFCLSLLLRYGMSANYQQNVSMQTFRKAFVRARSYDESVPHSRPGQAFDPEWDYENLEVEPALPSNTRRNVNYTVIEDKPVFSASGVLPIVERTPVGGSTEALCSLDMFHPKKYKYEHKGETYEYNRSLPRAEYEINGRRFSFTTAGFKELKPLPSTIEKKVAVQNYYENKDDGSCWEWASVDLETKVRVLSRRPTQVSIQTDTGQTVTRRIIKEKREEETKLYYVGDYLDGDNYRYGRSELKVGDTANFDVDKDDEEETIVEFLEEEHTTVKYRQSDGKELTSDEFVEELDGLSYPDAENFLRGIEQVETLHKQISGVHLIDYQEGEIDPNNEEKDGLQSDYSKKMWVGGSTFKRKENASGITTVDYINAQETFGRKIRNASGPESERDEDGNYYYYYPVVEPFSTQTQTRWGSAHE